MPTDDEDLFDTEEESEAEERPKPQGLDISRVSPDHDAEDVRIDNDADEPKEELDRRGKRRARGNLLKKLEERDEMLSTLRTEVSEMRGYVSGLSRAVAQPQGQQHDPLQQAIDQTYDAEDLLRQRAISLHQGGKATPEEQRRIDHEARQLEQRRIDLINRKSNRDSGIAPPDPSATARAVAAARFPDIHGSAQAAEFMRMSFQREVTAGAAPDDALLERCAAETRERFRMVKRPAPSNNDRARYTSTPSRVAGNADPSTVTHIHMGKAMKAIALQAYSHRNDLTDQKKIELWAKTHGRKLQGQQRA
jgi:hypothetical protein